MSLRHRRTASATPKAWPDERGASMLEVALALPVFLILVFGIIEFSYAFAQNNEIRHIARETAREASVDPAADFTASICNGLALIGDADITGISVFPASVTAGETATISVSANYTTLTGFFDSAFASTTLNTSHRFLVEQDATGWVGTSSGSCP